MTLKSGLLVHDKFSQCSQFINELYPCLVEYFDIKYKKNLNCSFLITGSKSIAFQYINEKNDLLFKKDRLRMYQRIKLLKNQYSASYILYDSTSIYGYHILKKEFSNLQIINYNDKKPDIIMINQGLNDKIAQLFYHFVLANNKDNITTFYQQYLNHHTLEHFTKDHLLNILFVMCQNSEFYDLVQMKRELNILLECYGSIRAIINIPIQQILYQTPIAKETATLIHHFFHP